MEKVRLKSEKCNYLCCAYTLSLILMPILGVYRIGTSQITLSDVITFIISAVIIFRNIKSIIRPSNNYLSIELSKPLFVFFTYIMLRLIINMLSGIFNVEHMWCTLRYCWGIVYVVLFAKNYFILDFAINSYTKVSMLVSVYGILQFIVLKLIGYYLTPAIFSFLGFRIDAVTMLYNGVPMGGYLPVGYNTSNFRIRSCFSEPSHLAEFLIIFIIIQLFVKDNEKNYFTIILALITLVLSASTTAYGCLIIFGVLWIIKNINKIPKKAVLLLAFLGIPLFVFIGYWIIQSDVANIVYQRVFINGSALTGRFGNYELVNIFFDDISDYIWGLGEIINLDNEFKLFFPSIARMIIYYGYSGIIGFFFAVIYLLKKSPKSIRVFALYLFVISIIDMIFFSYNILFTFAIMIALCKNDNKLANDIHMQ